MAENTQELLRSDSTSQIQPVLSTDSTVNKSSKKPLLLLVVFAIVMLLFAVGAAAYNNLVINDPDKIWEQAMQNTSVLFQEISTTMTDNPASGGRVDGSFSITSPFALTGSLNGKWYESNAQFNGEVGVADFKISGETRIVGSDASGSADIYTKIEGYEKIAPFIEIAEPGLATVLSAVNGNWYVLDASAQSDIMNRQEINETPEISPDELKNLTESINDIFSERLFATDQTKTVIVVEEAIGREDFDGDDSYKYKVKIQKQQFDELIAALTEELKGTPLEEILMQSIPLEDQLGDTSSEELAEKLFEIDFASVSAEVWVGMERNIFRNVRITMPETESVSGSIDFSLDYEGGNDLPMSVSLKLNDASMPMSSADITLGATINKETLESKLSFMIDSETEDQKTTANGNLNIALSQEPVEVEVPVDAKSIEELFGQLISGGQSTTEIENYFNASNYQLLDDVEL
jgi:hypothetical protein